MGILNVTPDSFYDGGRYATTAAAVTQGHLMVSEGADIVDVGGESTRPGAEPVSLRDELARVIPVIEALAPSVRISVDTMKPEVARAAIAAGATMVNDVSASLWEIAAEGGVAWVAMHMQGSPRDMQAAPHYVDLMAEVTAFLLERAAQARAAGVADVWVDPGIGFGKTIDHNLSLLRHLPELVAAADGAGCRGVAVGTSRKRFLGLLAGDRAGDRPAEQEDRAEGSLATAAAAMVGGARMVRVHDVGATLHAARLYGPAA
jgi:dihydropteroate synthase